VVVGAVMTDPTESPTPESLVLAEIRARHQPLCDCQQLGRPCDTAVVLAAYVDRVRAFDELAKRVLAL
jgi:hypothetical protein